MAKTAKNRPVFKAFPRAEPRPFIASPQWAHTLPLSATHSERFVPLTLQLIPE
jgi:hypothetical protein